MTADVLSFRPRARIGSRPLNRAKQTLEALDGVHACAVHKRRGGDYLDIIMNTPTGRITREVTVTNGMVPDSAVTHALRVSLGAHTADRYVTCY
ncbi:MAG: hypothetical protein ACR2K1_08810 [Saprospiraceae bacterium]